MGLLKMTLLYYVHNKLILIYVKTENLIKRYTFIL